MTTELEVLLDAEVKQLLNSLRYKPDMVITNPFDERVWLTEAYRDGKRIGITDCCLEAEPCDYHTTFRGATIIATGDREQ